MPRVEEIRHAEEEGVSFEFQVNPIAIEVTPTAGSPDCVASTPLGEPDGSGRRAPVPIDGSEHVHAL